MSKLINRIEVFMALTTGIKRNQHSVNMEGFKVYYEQIGSKNA